MDRLDECVCVWAAGSECVCSKNTHLLHANCESKWSLPLFGCSQTSPLINSPLSKWELKTISMQCLLNPIPSGIVKTIRLCSSTHDIRRAYAVVSLNRPHIQDGYHTCVHAKHLLSHTLTPVPSIRATIFS